MRQSLPIANFILVGESEATLRPFATQLEAQGCVVELCAGVAELIRRIHHEPQPDAVFVDLRSQQAEALSGLSRLRRLRPELKVVVLASSADVRTLVEAVRLGAQDYLLTPADPGDLSHLIDRLLDDERLHQRLREAAATNTQDFSFIAASPAMRKVRMQAVLLANVDLPLLILGESGTGKEMTARLIHRLSARARFPFHKLNCAAIPPGLLEAELFGYGDHAGAGRTGKLQLCHGGTLLLDEIYDLPLPLQARLVEYLQEAGVDAASGSLQEGAASARPDVRVFAACQGGVEQAVAEGRLREDLYYRLNAFTLHLPPLRERQEDMSLLLNNFVERLAPALGKPVKPVPPEVVEACRSYHWAGNLREMESLVRRYLVAGEAVTPDATRLPRPARPAANGRTGIAEGSAKQPAGSWSLRGFRAEAEAGAISRALRTTNWNRKQAARLLNISYRGLLYKMRQFNITPDVVEVSGVPESRA